jgi:hypothetical protein
MTAANETVRVGGSDDRPSVERRVSAAELALRGAGMALGQWYGHGDWAGLPWAARREAADSAAAELGEAARLLAGAREALAREIEAATERELADASVCQARWGVCPEHGNTLTSSGGRTRCRRPGCGRIWAGDRLAAHCDEPAVVVVADQAGGRLRLCAGHWADARERLVGARVVRVMTAAAGGAR